VILCAICSRPDVEKIDEEIRQGNSLASICRALAIPRNKMVRHRAHVITVAGTFDYEALAQRWLMEIDLRYRRGFRLALKWRDSSLYASLARQQGDLIKTLLVAVKTSAGADSTSDHLDPTTALKALTNSGWVRVSKEAARG
jgi:hypothetical protein